MDSSFGRKSERPKRKKRSFSPDIDLGAISTQGGHKRKKKKHNLLPPSYGANRPYDRLPNGMPFCCDLCKSPYVCNPLMSKRGSRTKRSKHQPCPRIKLDMTTGRKLTLCNACGLALDKPKPPKRTPKPTLTEDDKKKYLAEAKRFAATLAKDLKVPKIEDLYCPTIKRTPCKCLQRYILRGSTKEECAAKARHLVGLLTEARRLASLKSYDDSQIAMTGRRGKKNIGLGNGQKRSKQFENFVMSKRQYLRNKLELCERATQKVLCYSNNFLHKKLKTEERGCRIERVRGKCALGQLIPITELYKHSCCIDKCVRMSLTHQVLVEQWRERAQTGQAEARRVLAEMLTPVGGIRQNCYKFISMVTGCSTSTVSKVNDQMKETGGEREPPMHGLRKYWLTCTLRGKTGSTSDDTGNMTDVDHPDTPVSTVSHCTDLSNQEPEVSSTTCCSDQTVTSAESDPLSLSSDMQRERLLQLQQQLLQKQKNIQEQQRLVQAQLLKHTLIQDMNQSDESSQALLQQLSVPDELIQQQQQQQLPNHDVSESMMLQKTSTTHGSYQLTDSQEMMKSKTTENSVFHVQNRSQNTQHHQLIKTNVSQELLFKKMPKLATTTLTPPQVIAEPVAPQQDVVQQIAKPGVFQQLSKSDSSILAPFSTSLPAPRPLLRQMPKSQPVQASEVSRPNSCRQVPHTTFTLSGSQQIFSPVTQNRQSLTQQCPSVQNITEGNAAGKQHHVSTLISVPASHVSHKHSKVTSETRPSSQTGSKVATQKPAQLCVPPRVSSQHTVTQTASTSTTSTEQVVEAQKNIATFPFVILHNGTQSQLIQIPVASAPVVLASGKNTEGQNEKKETNFNNSTSVPFMFLQNIPQSQSFPVSVLPTSTVLSKSVQLNQNQNIPQNSKPESVASQKQNQAFSLSSSSRSGGMTVPVMVVNNTAPNTTLQFPVTSVFSNNENPQLSANLVSSLTSTANKSLSVTQPEQVPPSTLPYITGGTRIQIVNPVNLQQIQEMINLGHIQPSYPPLVSSVSHAVVSPDSQSIQKSNNQISDSNDHLTKPTAKAASVSNTVGSSSNLYSASYNTPAESEAEKQAPQTLSRGQFDAVVTTVVSSLSSCQSVYSSSTKNNSRSQNFPTISHSLTSTSLNNHKQLPEKSSPPAETTSFTNTDSKPGRQQVQYSVEPNTNSPLFLQPGSPVMDSVKLQHFLSSDDLSRTLDFDFSCSPLTMSDCDSRSRNSSGESIEPTISLDTSRELLQLLIQQGRLFTITNGPQ